MPELGGWLRSVTPRERERERERERRACVRESRLRVVSPGVRAACVRESFPVCACVVGWGLGDWVRGEGEGFRVAKSLIYLGFVNGLF
jgi:hypothetical protein